MPPPFQYVNPAAYEVPKDNTIANLAAEYEFAADDAACDTAKEKLIDCMDNLPEVKAFYEALAKAFEGACKAESDAEDAACPEDTSFEEAACKAAGDKLDTCLDSQGIAEKELAANKVGEDSATGACKSEYDAAAPCYDQGNSPQM